MAAVPMEAPLTLFCTQVLFLSGPALADGYVKLTVTVTDEELVHPVIGFVAVKLYVVVTLGSANGFDELARVKSFVGLQE